MLQWNLAFKKLHIMNSKMLEVIFQALYLASEQPKLRILNAGRIYHDTSL